MDSFHIWYKWSLAWEDVSHVMTFDLDLYLQGHSALTLKIVSSVASTVLDGFFPYLVQMITSMRRCDDLWPWPISSRSFDLDFENRVRSVTFSVLDWLFFTFGPRGRRARSARRPRGQNVAAIALDMGQAHLWYENNTMQTIHAIQTLRTVCGFLDMGDGCCLIFNKNQLRFIVKKSITAQIKIKKSFCSFRNKSRRT